MRLPIRVLATAGLGLLALAGTTARPALAAWPSSPYVNLPVCVSTGTQSGVVMVADGCGGYYVAWHDNRAGAGYDLYLQRLSANGAVDPAWPANGLAVCTAAGDQVGAKLVVDGAGGAIVAWQDKRGGSNYDLYAQHVLANGAASWSANGLPLTTATGDQGAAVLVSDNAGGAIVVWTDTRTGTADLYAMRALAAGTPDPAWTTDGNAVCTAANIQTAVKAIPDGAGGALLVWQDNRGGSNYDLYAHHLTARGVMDPSWIPDGTPVCTAANDQRSPMPVPDGMGGMLLAWTDLRSGSGIDVYSHHVLPNGAVDPAWPADGLAVCTAAYDQQNPAAVTDGAGGIVVAWQDGRSVVGTDIYATHALATGALDPAWPAGGRALCLNGSGQTSPLLADDGAGGAVAAWPDFRNGNSDVYAQRVARLGYLGTPEAEITGVKDVSADQGGKVKLSWNASWVDLAGDANVSLYEVWRSVPASRAAAAAAGGARVARDFALAPLPGRGAFVQPAGALGYAWEYVGVQVANHYILSYSLIAATEQDSTALGRAKTVFMVVARNAAGTTWWLSQPDSGYSVDNLAPIAPAPLTGQYAAGTTRLHWNPNPEADLAGYRLYRGASAGFTPSPATLVAAVSDTGFADPAGAPAVYKLTAVDVHGNESAIVTLLPQDVAAVAGGSPRALALARPSPNPAASGTLLAFALPRETAVSLAVYDAGGRLVRTLARGALPAGDRAIAWDLRDDAGRRASAGIYFVRLAAGSNVLVRRLAVLD
jgi:hypothetical protein